MKIFVQIAAYRDPELIKTIKSCIENAGNPKNLTFGIARQFHPDDKFDDLSEYMLDERFRILTFHMQNPRVYVGLEIKYNNFTIRNNIHFKLIHI